MKRYEYDCELNSRWFSSLPSHWLLYRVKNLITQNDSGAWGDDPTSENGTICLRVADMDFALGVFKTKNIDSLTRRAYSQEQIDKLILKQGDILIEKSGGGEKTPVGRSVYFDKEYKALFANFMQRLRARTELVTPRYLAFLFHAMYRSGVTWYYVKQTTGIQNLDLNRMLAEEKFPLPPHDEQDQIVRYLDWQVSKINRLIAAKKQEIALFEESKVNHIANVVLHGIRHHEHCIETTEFGSIPAHWQVIQNKRLFCERVEHTETGTETLLSVSKHYGVKPSAELTEDEQFATIKPALSLIGYKAVCKNDLVMNIMRARNGSYGISDYDGIVSPAYCIYYTTKECNVKYLHYFLRTPHVKSLFEAYSSGIAEHRRRLYPEDFLRLKSVLPPIEEQNEIVEHIELAIVKYDAGIANLRQQIACLQDMKTRLISDAVTGQVDVRDIEVPEYEVVEDTDTREEPEEDTEGEEYEE